jgi:hypothetical protein
VAPIAGAQTPAPTTPLTSTAEAQAPSASTESNTPAYTRPSILDDLFVGLGRDVRNLPSKTTFTWLGIGAVLASGAHPADQQVTNEMTESAGLTRSLHAGASVGGATGQLGGALATYAIGRLTGNAKITEVGGDLFRAQALTQGITAGIKLAVGRTRPDGTAYSFPSGHTATSFASAAVLQRQFGWKVGIPAYGVATYVAASRVQAKRHFLSDVAFGAAIGILVGHTVTVGHGDARFAVAPMATPHGGGVSFTLVGSR